MNPFKLILVQLIYRPIFNILFVLLALFDGNMWLAIIVLTLIVRLILLKPTMAGTKMQKEMGDIQPKMKEIQDKYKNDPVKMNEETMKLMKNQWAGPLKGCLMMLIQMPIFIGLFYVIKNLSTGKIDAWEVVNGQILSTWDIYSFLFTFVHQAWENIDNIFLWMNLYNPGYIFLAAIAGVLMYGQMKLAMLNKPKAAPKAQSMPGMPNMPDMSKMMGYMNIFFVGMMFFFVWQMPAGIGIYIVTSTTFGIIQNSIQFRELIKVKIKLMMGKTPDPEIIVKK